MTHQVPSTDLVFPERSRVKIEIQRVPRGFSDTFPEKGGPVSGDLVTKYRGTGQGTEGRSCIETYKRDPGKMFKTSTGGSLQ